MLLQSMIGMLIVSSTMGALLSLSGLSTKIGLSSTQQTKWSQSLKNTLMVMNDPKNCAQTGLVGQSLKLAPKSPIKPLNGLQGEDLFSGFKTTYEMKTPSLDGTSCNNGDPLQTLGVLDIVSQLPQTLGSPTQQGSIYVNLAGTCQGGDMQIDSCTADPTSGSGKSEAEIVVADMQLRWLTFEVDCHGSSEFVRAQLVDNNDFSKVIVPPSQAYASPGTAQRLQFGSWGGAYLAGGDTNDITKSFAKISMDHFFYSLLNSGSITYSQSPYGNWAGLFNTACPTWWWQNCNGALTPPLKTVDYSNTLEKYVVDKATNGAANAVLLQLKVLSSVIPKNTPFQTHINGSCAGNGKPDDIIYKVRAVAAVPSS